MTGFYFGDIQFQFGRRPIFVTRLKSFSFAMSGNTFWGRLDNHSGGSVSTTVDFLIFRCFVAAATDVGKIL
jgi:hypothetical protein